MYYILEIFNRLIFMTSASVFILSDLVCDLFIDREYPVLLCGYRAQRTPLCASTLQRKPQKRHIAERRAIVIFVALSVGVVTYKLFLIVSYNACDSICVLQINWLCWYSVADHR